MISRRSAGPSEAEKAVITASCQRFIDEILKPRFLPAIRPTKFNYPVDIRGKWQGNRYRFLTRYRSGWPDNEGEEFDAPFARLDWIGRDRFNIQWHRHTGTWFCLYRGLSLARALEVMESDGHLHPLQRLIGAGDALHLAIATNRSASAIYTLDKSLISAGKILGLPVKRGIGAR